MTCRNRTSSKYNYYGFYFYFCGLSLRKASQILSLHFIKRNHVSIWNWWIQKYKHQQKISSNKRKIKEFIIDETLIKVGSLVLVWLWWVVLLNLKVKESLESPYQKKETCFSRAIIIQNCIWIWQTLCFIKWRNLASLSSL